MAPDRPNPARETELAWIAALGRCVRLTCWRCGRQAVWRPGHIQKERLGAVSLAQLRRHRTKCCRVLTRVEVLKSVAKWERRSAAELWVVEDWTT